MAKTAIIFEAHNDDLYVGLGGTIIKLVKEDYNIIEVIFSAGQRSHPHYKEDIIIKKRRRIIKKYKPVKIFTTSKYDPHPDHRAVNESVIKVVNDLNYKNELYTYEVWNIVNENNPVVYNDISNYFKAKIAMMKACKSQWMWMYALLIPVYLRAKLYGIKNKFKYAEKLYRLR